MLIEQKNFKLAKAVKALGDPDNFNFYSLHITQEYTEIYLGTFAVRMRHSQQQGFAFEPSEPISVRLTPEDALNIASSLGKKGGIKAVIPTDDRKQVQIEFESGEIRILPTSNEKFPDIVAAFPKKKPLFEIAVNVEALIATLQAFSLAEMSSAVLEFRGTSAPVVVRPLPESDSLQAIIAPMVVAGLVDIAPASRKHVPNVADDQTQVSIGLQ